MTVGLLSALRSAMASLRTFDGREQIGTYAMSHFGGLGRGFVGFPGDSSRAKAWSSRRFHLDECVTSTADPAV